MYEQYITQAAVLRSDSPQAAKTRVIFVSFETLRKPSGVDVFIPFARQPPTLLQSEIAKATSETASRQSESSSHPNPTTF